MEESAIGIVILGSDLIKHQGHLGHTKGQASMKQKLTVSGLYMTNRLKKSVVTNVLY